MSAFTITKRATVLSLRNITIWTNISLPCNARYPFTAVNSDSSRRLRTRENLSIIKTTSVQLNCARTTCSDQRKQSI